MKRKRAPLTLALDIGGSGITLSSLSSYVDGETSQQQDGNGLGSAWDLPLLTETRFPEQRVVLGLHQLVDGITEGLARDGGPMRATATNF